MAPRGYVCVGDEATLDSGAAIVRAAAVRPDLTKPLPYHYGFVRAVAPLDLKVPTKEEQLASEFALERHLAWWTREGASSNTLTLGANDVALDSSGVAIDGAPPPAGAKLSVAMTQGELFAGVGDSDPIPFWLQGQRQIPNVSGFKVPTYAVFADRLRRHTGLAFVGSFPTGDDSFRRRFAITTHLRLVPATKVKPDSASPVPRSRCPLGGRASLRVGPHQGSARLSFRRRQAFDHGRRPRAPNNPQDEWQGAQGRRRDLPRSIEWMAQWDGGGRGARAERVA